jgi:hypothetical protein
MAETWNKRERERNKRQKRQQKLEKKQDKKQNKNHQEWTEMIAYVDENGNPSSNPVDGSRPVQGNRSGEMTN